jgi:hypothetical protein
MPRELLWRTVNALGSTLHLAGGAVVLRIGIHPMSGEWYSQIGNGPKHLLEGCQGGEEARQAAVKWAIERAPELVGAFAKDIHSLAGADSDVMQRTAEEIIRA